jgi:hypothetical protein
MNIAMRKTTLYFLLDIVYYNLFSTIECTKANVRICPPFIASLEINIQKQELKDSIT